MSDKSTKISALVVTGITSFLAPFMLSGVNIILPSIQKEFSVNAVALNWIASSSILATSVLLIPAGKLADIYGRKKIYVLGIIVFTISSFLCAFAGSIETLIILRMIQGTGSAMLITTGVAILISIFPVKERGSAIGINVAAIYLGLSAGPFIGGLINYYFSWKYIFLCIAPFGLTSIVLSILFLKGEWADAKGEKFDLIGSIIYGISLVMLMYGVSILPQMKAFIMIISGCIGLVGFTAREIKIGYPVFEVRLFRHNKIFLFSSLATLINYASTFAITFLLSLYLQYILNMSSRKAGFVLVAQPIMQAIISPYAGRLSDRIEPAIIATIGMAINTIGLLLLAFLNPGISLAFIICVLIFLGFGYALFSSPNTNAIMSSVEKRHYGIASGSVATMRSIGMTLSMAITTIVFAINIGETEITPAHYSEFESSVRIAFIIFAVLSAAGAVCSSARGKLNRGNNNA
ncbi:MAG: MFS transporter [Spirochaetota bacterium]